MAEWIVTAEPGAEDEVYEFVDPKTRRTLTLPKKINGVDLKGLHEGIIEKSKTTAKNQFREEIEEYKVKIADYDEMKSRIAEYETNGLTAAQKAKLEGEKTAAEIKKAREDADRAKQSLNSYILKNAVLEGFGKVKNLADVNKAAVLFNAEYQPKLVEKNGELVPVIDYEGQELSVSEVQAKWIARDDNKILLQNTLQSGAGSTGGQGQVQGKTIKAEAFLKLPFAEQNKLIAEGVKPVD